MNEQQIAEYNLVVFAQQFEDSVNNGLYVSDEPLKYPNFGVLFEALMVKDSPAEFVKVEVDKTELEVIHPTFGEWCKIVQAYIRAGYTIDQSIEKYPRQYEQYVATMAKKDLKALAEKQVRKAKGVK